jgi:hypothetical protein
MRYGRAMKLAMVAFAAAALVAPTTARARTLALNWTETTNSRFGYPAMTFTVKSVTIRGGSWSVCASVTNRSAHQIAVVTEPSPYLPYRFGLLAPKTHPAGGFPETLTHATTWLGAVSFAPSPPAVLRRGHTWRGTFSGRGTIPRGTLISVTFGDFLSPQVQWNFSWTTNHAFRL